MFDHWQLELTRLDFYPTIPESLILPPESPLDYQKSNEKLFIDHLQLGSNDDPDSRYINDAISHLQAYEVVGSGFAEWVNKGVLEAAGVSKKTSVYDLTQRIFRVSRDHNEKVGKFQEWKRDVVHGWEHATGLMAAYYDNSRIPDMEWFNANAVFSYFIRCRRWNPETPETLSLDIAHELTIPDYFILASKDKLEFNVHWATEHSIASSRSEDKLKKLKEIIDGAADIKEEYLRRHDELETAVTQIDRLIALLKTNVGAVSNDIEDGRKLKGDCLFEQDLKREG